MFFVGSHFFGDLIGDAARVWFFGGIVIVGFVGGVVAGSVDSSMSWDSSQSSNRSSVSECCVVVVFGAWLVVCWSCCI